MSENHKQDIREHYKELRERARSYTPRMSSKQWKWVTLLGKFHLVGILIFFSISWCVGTAHTGKIEDGIYYLGNGLLGDYIEVSRIAYMISAGYMVLFHLAISFIVFLVVCFLIKRYTIKDFMSLAILLIIIPLVVGCGFLMGAYESLICVIHAIHG